MVPFGVGLAIPVRRNPLPALGVDVRSLAALNPISPKLIDLPPSAAIGDCLTDCLHGFSTFSRWASCGLR